MGLTVPNTIVNDTPADAVPINTNYQTIESYVNTNTIARDGSVAMTGQLTLVSDPTQDNHAARKSYVDAILPIGVMFPWLGVAAPAGQWALANGAALSVTTYAKLYNVLGTRYGGAGGTFNLPNMAGMVPVAVKADDARYGVLGNSGGSTKVPIPAHKHGINHNHGSIVSGGHSVSHTHTINHDHAAFTTAAGGPHSHDVKLLNVHNPTDGADYASLVAWTSPVVSGTTNINALNDGTHTHSINVPMSAGLKSGPTDVNHTHNVDLPALVADSAEASLEVIDADGLKSTTDFHAPFVVINYIVRIA